MIRANEELASYYESIVKKFLETSQVPEGYEGPFLAAAPKNYEQARFKWMYMGQQGNGFECVSSPSDVRGAMEGTASFQGNGGPFWQFGKELEKELNPGLVERSFVWSNIARIQKIKVDGRVPGELLDFWIRQRLTATEIETLHPMFVLFVTGPDYVDLLRTEFPG